MGNKETSVVQDDSMPHTCQIGTISSANIPRQKASLQKIYIAFKNWQQDYPPPKKACYLLIPQIIFCAAASAILLWILKSNFPENNLLEKSFNLTPLLGAIVLLVVCILMRKAKTLPSTHIENLDKLLAEYTPVSSSAYEHLQNGVRAHRSMDEGLIDDWLEIEIEAIQHCENALPEISRFLREDI